MGDFGALLMGNVPEVLFMLVGVGLLVFEMYLPGFGVPGILGGILMVIGFVLIGPSLSQGLLLFVILAAILCIALSICLFTASKGRLNKSKLVLNDVAVSAEAAENGMSNNARFFFQSS